MSFTAKTCYYFEKPGPANTGDTAHIAVERAKELGLTTIVVATHVMGFSKPGEWEFDQKIAEDLRRQGVVIVTGTHVLSGLERAISRSKNLGGSSRTEAIAEALRRVIAVGLKVAVECVLIAADQGAIGIDEEVVAVGGTATGADTVCVIRPANTASFFDLQVREIVAIPRVR